MQLILKLLMSNCFLRACIVGLMLVLSGCMETPEKENNPNIIIIIEDDPGWCDVGYHGAEIKTPVMDELYNIILDPHELTDVASEYP